MPELAVDWSLAGFVPHLSPHMFGRRWWDLLPEFMREDDAHDLILGDWVTALGNLVQSTVEWLEGASWVDPATVPPGLLPFVAAIGGYDVEWVPAGEQRAFVGSAAARARGSVAAITARVAANLIGAKQVMVLPYDGGDEWALRVQVFTAETTSGDWQAAARAEAPAWLTLVCEPLAGMTYDQLAAKYATYDVMQATGKDYKTLSQEAP